jgi:hypothetical protein
VDLDLDSPPQTLRLGLEGRNLFPQRRIICLELVLPREGLILLLILRLGVRRNDLSVSANVSLGGLR